MTMIDPEKERMRLTDFYSRELDGRLEKVAGEAYELSDLAREVLKTELLKRGLNVELAEHAPVRMRKSSKPSNAPKEVAQGMAPAHPSSFLEQEFMPPHLVAIRIFRDLPQALLAKGSLDSAGIDCMLADDNLERLDWFYSNAVGGIKLLVKERDAAEAEQFLSQPIPEFLEVEGVGEYQQQKCPTCGSLDVNFRELDPATYLSLGGSYWGVCVPIPIHRRAWSCHSCDAEWEEDGDPASESST
jgi:hypothetical protein